MERWKALSAPGMCEDVHRDACPWGRQAGHCSEGPQRGCGNTEMFLPVVAFACGVGEGDSHSIFLLYC